MSISKLEKLVAHQRALAVAIRIEQRRSRYQKQKALYTTVKRLGMLNLRDDQIETALRAFCEGHSTNSDNREDPK